MPYYKDLEVFQNVNGITDTNLFNKYNFYLAKEEAKMFAEWQIFNTLFGKMNWTSNMGSTMRSVKLEPSPVSRSEFYPNLLTTQPKKDIIEVQEATEETQLCWQYFDSKQFHFLANFQDFIENHVDPTHKDMTNKIVVTGDQFISSFMNCKCPNIYIPGNTTAGEDYLIQAATVPSGTPITAATAAAVRGDAFWQATVAKIGVAGLTLNTIDDITCVLRDDLMAPAFEGTVNQPKDNELIKGKYVGVGSFEAFQCIKYDPNFSGFRNINLDIVTQGFKGSIFDALTWKFNRYPLRIAADGTRPPPQILDEDTKRTRPNPAYVNAPFETMWFLGADVIKTIKVGPPPKPFGSKMSSEKFFSMDWNGVVRTTDQLMVNYVDEVGNSVTDLNYRGEKLKLFSTVVYGAIPVVKYNAVQAVYRRRRPSDFSVVGA